MLCVTGRTSFLSMRLKSRIRRIFSSAALFILCYLLRQHGETDETTHGELASTLGNTNRPTLISSNRVSNRSTLVASNRVSWTDSHSPNHLMEQNIRISFRLYDPMDGPDPYKFASGYTCNKMNHYDLPPSLSGKSILNFTVSISTNLKILFMGDSVVLQFMEAFESAVIGSSYETRHTRLLGTNDTSMKCLTAVAPIRGGGVAAFWRLNGILAMGRKKKWPKSPWCRMNNMRNWSERQAIALLDHEYSELTGEGNHTTVGKHESLVLGSFDAVVIRVPHGWMELSSIDKEGLVECINLCNRYLGAHTVIITTIPFTNNVKTPQDWEGVIKINKMI